MGIDLHGCGIFFSILADDWGEILALANGFGWKPKGTKEPENYGEDTEPKWDGSYYCRDGQLIEEEDAHQIFCALKRAMAKMNEEDELPPSKRTIKVNSMLVNDVAALVRAGSVTIS